MNRGFKAAGSRNKNRFHVERCEKYFPITGIEFNNHF